MPRAWRDARRRGGREGPIGCAVPSANRCARRVIHCSVPSMLSGSPTTSASGFQVAMSRSMAFQSGFVPRTGIVSRGAAVPVRVCPTALPIRFSPKSNATSVLMSSGMLIGTDLVRRNPVGTASQGGAAPTSRGLPSCGPHGSARRVSAGAPALAAAVPVDCGRVRPGRWVSCHPRCRLRTDRGDFHRHENPRTRRRHWRRRHRLQCAPPPGERGPDRMNPTLRSRGRDFPAAARPPQS